MQSAQCYSVVDLRRKWKTEVTQKLLLLEVRKASVSTEKKQNTNPHLQPNQKNSPSRKKQHTRDRKAALKQMLIVEIPFYEQNCYLSNDGVWPLHCIATHFHK